MQQLFEYSFKDSKLLLKEVENLTIIPSLLAERIRGTYLNPMLVLKTIIMLLRFILRILSFLDIFVEYKNAETMLASASG